MNFSILLFATSLHVAPIALSNSDPVAFSLAQMLIGDTAEGEAARLTNCRNDHASRTGSRKTGIQKIDLIPRQSLFVADVGSSSAETEKSSGFGPTKLVRALRRKDRRTAAQRQLDDAFILYSNEQNERALAIVDGVIAEFESNRKDTDIIYYCARDRSEKAALVKLAAKNRQQAEIGGSEWCDALFHKAVLMSEFKRFDEADRAFAQSVDMAPFDMGGLRKYAVWLQDREQWQKAIDVFRSAISLNEYVPQKSRADFPARAHRGIGFGLIALGRLDEAEASYRESLKYDPDDSFVPLELDYIEMLRENRVPIDYMRAVER